MDRLEATLTTSSSLLAGSTVILVLAGFAHRDFASRGGDWRRILRNVLFVLSMFGQGVGWSLKIGGF